MPPGSATLIDTGSAFFPPSLPTLSTGGLGDEDGLIRDRILRHVQSIRRRRRLSATIIDRIVPSNQLTEVITSKETATDDPATTLNTGDQPPAESSNESLVL
jgi:hypothetical protein